MACVCLYVSVAVTSRNPIKTTERIELVLAWNLSTYLHCVVWKFRCLQKLGYFPVELCPKWT